MHTVAATSTFNIGARGAAVGRERRDVELQQDAAEVDAAVPHGADVRATHPADKHREGGARPATALEARFARGEDFGERLDALRGTDSVLYGDRPASHDRPRPNPAAHFSVASV